MGLYDNLLTGKEKIAIIGLGYVGMPLAVAFARRVPVIGFDLNSLKIEKYRQGIDPTNEIGDDEIKKTTVDFTADENRLKETGFLIIAVPTPINSDKTPDLYPVENASRIVGRNLRKGSVVVYESTVYPGVTENVCIPILEEESGLECGVDFKVGYSPERINPGDKVNRLENICKIVSGIDSDSLEEIASVYEMIIEAGVFKAGSIKVAEAAKVVENSQRDINIAFMNELAMVFDRMDIDTMEVVEAMNTKWNALGFTPGLVGGHCIGVDPYYFIYEAENLGYHSQIISSGRKINDGMGKFVADAVVKHMILKDINIRESRVAVFGLTFKENTPDIRNSKVIDIVSGLKEFEVEALVYDPYAEKEETEKEYGIKLSDIEDIQDLDVLVVAVAHDSFRNMSMDEMSGLFKNRQNKILIDVKSIYDKDELEENGYSYWRL